MTPVILEGTRNHGEVEVKLNGTILHPARSFALKKHSPDGFEWGYGGSGPAQLALAVLLELYDDEKKVLQRYQDFKWDVISTLPRDSFKVEIDSKWCT